MNLQSHAKNISDPLKDGLGFDPMTLVEILLLNLANCFKQTTSSQETPSDYLADHYDETTSTFDQSLINRCRPQTRRAARQDGNRRLSRSQLDLITVAALERARTADHETVSAVMDEIG